MSSFLGPWGRKGKDCQGWGVGSQDSASISLAWQLKRQHRSSEVSTV